jgi:hypothetical protein
MFARVSLPRYFVALGKKLKEKKRRSPKDCAAISPRVRD